MNNKQTTLCNMWKYASMLWVIAIFLFFSGFQTKAEEVNEMNVVQQDTVKSNIWFFDEAMPQFPGGDEALMKWLSDNIQYPAEAVKKGIHGRVVLRFVIKADGSVEDVEVVKSLDSLCDKEALRVVKMMPKWIPGIRNRMPADVYYSLPVTFKLPIRDASNKTDSVQHIPVLDRNKHFLKDSTQIIKSDTGVIIVPKFPGGEVALAKYLGKNISYPIQEERQGIQGTVVLKLRIDPNGSVKEVEVEKSVNPNLDKEALRVVKKIPKWIPATKNGVPVSIYYRLPVTFRLRGR